MISLLKTIIEAAFYYFPQSAIADYIFDEKGNNTRSGEEDILSSLMEIVKWKNVSFTKSEVEEVKMILKQEFLKGRDDFYAQQKCSCVERIFLLLSEYGKEVLDLNGNMPLVNFDKLLQWRALSVLVGEDILTLPTLAQKNLVRRKSDVTLLWPDALEHDYTLLNFELSHGLSDTHTHIGAAFDVFGFNWINMMNYPRLNIPKSKRKGFLEYGERLEYDPTVYVSKFIHYDPSLLHWGVIAARIRLEIFDFIYHNKKIDFQPITEAVASKCGLINTLDKCRSYISVLRSDGLRSKEGYVLDYAIQTSNIKGVEERELYSCNMVHYGERALLYKYFLLYFGNNKQAAWIAPMVWLYLLIKNKIRREFIATNILHGFENFKDYQDSKTQFLPPNKTKKRYFDIIKSKYAVQSSVGSECKDFLEARLKPEAVEEFVKCKNLLSPIFSKKYDNVKWPVSHIAIVPHFIKKREKAMLDGSLRYFVVRKELRKELAIVLKWYKRLLKSDIPIVGLDAAGSELDCRPEVFAPIFRKARIGGLMHFTFHAGEDFYDILDGLRAIDETTMFMGYKPGDRLGHALALGIDVRNYYAYKHNILIMPRQVLLDNLVWLKFKSAQFNISLSPHTISIIEKYFSDLTGVIGYNCSDKDIYWQSMLMRGDDPIPEAFQSNEVHYSRCSPKLNSNIKCDSIEQILKSYYRSADIRKNGNKVISVKIDDAFIEDVASVQEAFLSDMERRGIIIETNPSSNIKIGPFDRYDQHPIFRFNGVNSMGVEHSIPVSINTDDKGIFATSLKNEYSLIAAALKNMADKETCKPVFSDLMILNYIRRIVDYGKATMFKIDSTL